MLSGFELYSRWVPLYFGKLRAQTELLQDAKYW